VRSPIAAARALGARAGRSYVVGPDLPDLARLHGAAARRGYSVEACYWPRPGEDPNAVAAGYLAAVEILAAPGGAGRLAVKASQLGFDSSALAPVLARCEHDGIPVMFDALEVGESDGVRSMVEAVHGAGVALGCALAGRWPRSAGDLEWALEHELRVRVVKGQYADPDHPDADPRAGFLALVDGLAGRAPFVSVATHDRALAREALKRLRARGTACELELLYGFPLRHSVRDARASGVPVRLYLPYGHGRTPYPPRAALRAVRTTRILAADVLLGAARARLPLPAGKVQSGPC
jgi:proline dehydrogenase